MELTVDKGLNGVKLYHNDKPVDGAKYDADTGIITFTTTSFSPFTVVYNKPLEPPKQLTDSNGMSYNEPTEEDGMLIFTSKEGEDAPNVTFTADPESKELTLTDGKAYSGEVTLPAAIAGEDGTIYPLTTIDGYALGCDDLYYAIEWGGANQNITSVTIPDTVKSIGEAAFGCCQNLTSVEIPNSVETIGDNAFSNCEKLKSVTIPNSVETIGANAFRFCKQLTSVTIPDSVTTISSGAFGSTSITEVTIPESITEISTATFSSCEKLTSVTIPNSVTKIGNLAFSKCTALTSITIPENVTFIDNDAFNGSGLQSVTIPASVTTLGTRVFSGCESLTQLIIPNTVTKMGSLHFQGCKNLTKLVLPECVNKLIPPSAAFMDCNALENIYYSATDTELRSNGTYSRQNNSAFEKAAKYVYSANKPTATKIQSVTVSAYGNPSSETFEYWYWHMVDGVPTPWDLPTT